MTTRTNLQVPLFIASAVAIAGAALIQRRSRQRWQRAVGGSLAAMALRKVGMSLLALTTQQLVRRGVARWLASGNPVQTALGKEATRPQPI